MPSVPLSIMAADFVPSEGQPLPYQAGSAVLVQGYLFADAAVSSLQLAIRVPSDYASGGTLTLPWYGQVDTTGDVEWGVSYKAVTPNTDTGDMEALAWAAETVGVDSHLGTTATRPHSIDILPSALDSMAAGDLLLIRIRRNGTSGSDSYTDDVVLMDPTFTYTA